MNWNTIRAHNWNTTNQNNPDELYEKGIKYLKGELKYTEYSQRFRERMSFYKLRITDDTEELVIEDNDIPPFYQNTFYNGPLPVIYTVVRPSQKERKINEIFEQITNHALNPNTLYQRVIEAKLLGINRDTVAKFLKNKYIVRNLSQQPITPVIRSFRPSFPFEYWQMDLIDFHKDSHKNKGYSYILVIIDIFSKFIYLYPIKDKTTISVRNVLQRIFLSGDIPMKLGSDRGPEFTGKELEPLLKHFGVNLIIGKPYSPQTQGFVENKNKQIKQSIAMYISKYKVDAYYDMLDSIAFAINNLKHSVTKLSPMEVHRGRKLGVTGFFNAIDTVEYSQDREYSKKEYEKVVEIQKQLHNKRVEIVRKRIFETADKREEKERRNKPHFEVGDFVHLTTYTLSTDKTKLYPLQIYFTIKVENGKLKKIKLENPLYHISMDTGQKVFTKGIKAMPTSMYPSILKKTVKWKFKGWPSVIPVKRRNVFVITKRTMDKRYKLAYVDHSSDNKWTIYRHTAIKDKKFSDLFHSNELFKIQREDLEMSYTTPTRPDFGFLPSYLKTPVSIMDKQTQQVIYKPVIFASIRFGGKVTVENVEQLFKKRQKETWSAYKSRITKSLNLPNRQTLSNVQQIPAEKQVRVIYGWEHNDDKKYHPYEAYLLGFDDKNPSDNFYQILGKFNNERTIHKLILHPKNYKKTNGISLKPFWYFLSSTDPSDWN